VRESKHSTVPSSVPTAIKPCSFDTSTQLSPSLVAARIGFRKRPCSRFRRYTSLEDPTTSKSPVWRTYVMSRPCLGVRVL
jgi:hypothetical protein